MPRNQSATGAVVEGHLTPVAEGVEKALRGGIVLSPLGISMLMTPSKEVLQAQESSVKTFLQLLKSAEKSQADEALRGVVSDDGDRFTVYVVDNDVRGANGQMYTAESPGAKATKVPPAVFYAVKKMALQAARVRLSEFRRIRDAFYSGKWTEPTKTQIHNVVKHAASILDQASRSRAAAAKRTAYQAAMAEAAKELNLPEVDPNDADKPYIPTSKEYAELRKRAEMKVAEQAEEVDTEKETKSIDRNRDRVIKAQGWDKARKIAEAILAMTGTKAHPKQPPKETEGTTENAEPAVVAAVKSAGGRRGRKTHTGRMAAVH